MKWIANTWVLRGNKTISFLTFYLMSIVLLDTCLQTFYVNYSNFGDHIVTQLLCIKMLALMAIKRFRVLFCLRKKMRQIMNALKFILADALKNLS